MRHTTVSFKGTPDERQMLAIIASVKGITVGELVRQAVYKTYAVELEQVKGNFFTQSGNISFQKGKEIENNGNRTV